MGMNMRSEADTMIQKIKDNAGCRDRGSFDFDSAAWRPAKDGCKLCEEETGVPNYYIEAIGGKTGITARKP